MLVIGGVVRYTAPTGEAWTFAPSFARVETLGTPQEVVDLLAGLFGARAAEDARYLLTCLCDREDATPVLGWLDEARVSHAGLMSEAMQIALAQYLMQLSLCGAGAKVLSQPEYLSILDMKFMDRAPSPSWTAYIDSLKEMAND